MKRMEKHLEPAPTDTHLPFNNGPGNLPGRCGVRSLLDGEVLWVLRSTSADPPNIFMFHLLQFSYDFLVILFQPLMGPPQLFSAYTPLKFFGTTLNVALYMLKATSIFKSFPSESCLTKNTEQLDGWSGGWDPLRFENKLPPFRIVNMFFPVKAHQLPSVFCFRTSDHAYATLKWHVLNVLQEHLACRLPALACHQYSSQIGSAQLPDRIKRYKKVIEKICSQKCLFRS